MEKLIFFELMQPDDVIIYYFRLHLFHDCEAILAANIGRQAMERAKRFKFEEDRLAFIVRHSLLRFLLSSYTSIPLNLLDVREDNNGKPFCITSKEKPIFFNMSRSEDVAAIAISRHCSLGVDIEKIKPIAEMQGVVKRHFSNNEKKIFFSCRNHQKLGFFYRFWTRKEAVLKALGTGLLAPPEGVDVSFGGCSNNQPECGIAFSPEMKAVYVKDLDELPGYSFALASMRSVGYTRIQEISPAMIGI